jgi:hypothetical protein
MSEKEAMDKVVILYYDIAQWAYFEGDFKRKDTPARHAFLIKTKYRLL